MKPCFTAALGTCLLGLSGPLLAADPPDWWTDLDVTNASPAHDFGPANIGQAKWMTTKALEALALQNPHWAARVRARLKRTADLSVPSPTTPTWLDKQKAPLRLGQLKTLAKPFYDTVYLHDPEWLDYPEDHPIWPGWPGQLQINGTKDPVDNANYLPWTSGTLDDRNTAMANVGQLKAVFALRFDTMYVTPYQDPGHNGADDYWEMSSGTFGHTDPDGDGMDAQTEYTLGFDPTSTPTVTAAELARDLDGDGMPDYWEAKYLLRTQPTSTPPYNVFERRLDWEYDGDAGEDPDQDGLTNLQEFQHGTDPFDSDTDDDDLLDGAEVTNGTDPTELTISAKILALASAMDDAVDTRIAGKTASTDMPLFSNTTANWTSTTFVPNASSWLIDSVTPANSIRSQFTGIHMYAGGWTQSYGLMPITSRHCISCGHNGPLVGDTVRYVNVDGTVFETTITEWINDYPGMPSSDTKQTALADLSVYLLADPLPSWVAQLPIFPALTAAEKKMMTALDPPLVCVSQGTVVPPTAIPDSLTPNNRKAYIARYDGRQNYSGARGNFFHFRVPGDSGTPEYIVVGNQVYLYGVTIEIDDSEPVADYISYINSLIVRADAAASIRTGTTISTGYTVSAAAWPLP